MRPSGGFLEKNVAPTQTSASGIWTVREVNSYKRAGTWAALPGAPTSVTGAAGNAQVSLTWTTPASTGGYSITDYSIQYSGDSGSTWNTFSRSASASTSGTVTGLTNGTAYMFRVATVTTLGIGAYSAASSSLTPVSFTPTAVLLTSGTSYTVPSGATSMKAWAVGGGQGQVYCFNFFGNAGGVAYKTWSVTGGQSVSYSIGSGGLTNTGSGGTTAGTGSDTTVTFSGATIAGLAATQQRAGGSFSGGDGGTIGGTSPTLGTGGAVGGNSSTASCGRIVATDVSGLFAAIALAGGKTVENCQTTAAFGSGSIANKYGTQLAAGFGGGGSASYNGGPKNNGGSGAVVLYFT